MHVLYIHQHFATNQGSLGTRSYDYARFLVERGHKVTVLTGYYPGSGIEAYAGPGLVSRFEVDGIDVVLVRVTYENRQGVAGRLISFGAFALASSVIAASLGHVDVVFATSTPLTVGIPALAARFLRGRPYVFEVRDIWPEMLVSAGVLRNRALIAAATLAEETFYRHARRVVGISRGIADRLHERGQPRDKLRVLFTGVDTGLYEGVAPRHDVLAQAGLAGRVVAVYAGAHSLANHLEYVLDAAERLRDEPRVAFLLVGRGKDRDALMASARARGLSNVVFLPQQPKQTLVGILKACDVGLMVLKDVPDFTAAMPNKFFDYLAASLPVLVNFPGELAGHLAEYDCGRYVSAKDPGELARVLVDLAALPAEERRAMGQRAARLVAERFDRRALVAVMEGILEDARS